MKRYPSASITPAPPSASNRCMARSALATFRIADLAQLLEAAVDAMVITRSDGRIVGVNTKTETLFGYPREELLGQKSEMLMSLHLATLRWSRFRKRYVKPRTRNDAHSTLHLLGLLKLEGRRRDGSKFPMEISMGLMELGGETMLSSAIQDITERTLTEELPAHLTTILKAPDNPITVVTMAS